MLKFVILFRECLNEYGWQKKLESDKDFGEDQITSEKEFAAENNAEHAPEICNEFVTVFLEQQK